MRRFLAIILLCLPALVTAQTLLTPPVAPLRPASDNYFGTVVIDPYRWMETSTDELQAYMKAENAVTLQALQPFVAQNGQILTELTNLFDTVVLVRNTTRVLDRYYYLELLPGQSDFGLMTRAVSGGDAQLLLDPSTLAEDTKHAAIDYFVPSPDGKYVAVGVSLGGSENSVLYVVNSATGKLMSEAIPRAQEAQPSWTDDSSGFYLARLQFMTLGVPASAKYDNMRVYLHHLGGPEETDKPIFGPDITTDPSLPKSGNVWVRVVPGTSMILAFQVSGVVETPAVWVRRTETASWVRVVRHEDGMMNLALHGTRAYIKTKGGAGGAVSNGRVVSFDLASQTFESAQTLIPASDLVLSANRGTGLVTAADAVYVYGFRDGTGVVLRVPYDGNTKPSELHLPISGTITGVDADPRRPGFLCVMSGWTMPQLIYSYTPSSSTFADTHLQPHNPRISP